jgi:hypothetical protein
MESVHGRLYNVQDGGMLLVNALFMYITSLWYLPIRRIFVAFKCTIEIKPQED